MKFSTLIVTLLLQYTKSSVVIDSLSQKGLYVSEFCPKAKNCPDGAHVMCMYYNPLHTMGPRCYRPKNVTITPALAETWLELTNGIRSQLALGKEKGKGGGLLPRAYGMFKLKWDSELATFAQILANHCVLRHDLCRATSKFPDPGQTAGIVRFTYNDWIPISRKGHFTKPGLTMSKLKYSITQALRTWYKGKEEVTPEMITTYSDWAKVSRETPDGRLYLEMIHGPTTHMGCGMSAYTEYAFYDNRAALNYNSVQVICNYSSRPQHGVSVYRVDPPTEVGYTVRCGCPEGTDEDEDCLCIDNQKTALGAEAGAYYSRADDNSKHSCSKSGHCKPAVVLLPIFTVENAPPEKLIARSGFEMPQFNKKEFEVEISDLYDPENTSVLHSSANYPPTNIQHVLSNIINEGYSKNNEPTSLLNSLTMDTHLPASNYPNMSLRVGYSNIRVKEPHSVISSLVDEAKRDVQLRITTPHKPLIRDVKKRSFGKHLSPQLSLHNLKTIHPTFSRFKKKSVFAKVATFELPKQGESSIIKPDVQARKDFSSIKNLAQDYLNFKKDAELTDFDKYESEVKRHSDVEGKNQIQKPRPKNELEELQKTVENIHDKYNDYENEIRPISRSQNSLYAGKLNHLNQRNIIRTKEGYESNMKHPFSDVEEIRANLHKSIFNDGNDIKSDHINSDKEVLRTRHVYLDNEDKKSKYLEKRKFHNEDDPLGIDRRRYYQARLEHLERKLHNTRRHHDESRDNNNRQMRPVLSTTRDEQSLRPSKNRPDTFYMPDRARFLHGF